MKDQHPQIKTYRAKLITTTNHRFAHYCGEDGLLAVPPLGYSPQFQADDGSFSILTMSWLVATDEYSQYVGEGKEVQVVSLQTKNSVYDFELLDD